MTIWRAEFLTKNGFCPRFGHTDHDDHVSAHVLVTTCPDDHHARHPCEGPIKITARIGSKLDAINELSASSCHIAA